MTEEEVAHGLRMLTLEGVTSIGFWSITTSGLLAAFALALGADNFQIGVLAAIPFIIQPLQIPAILLVERLRRRKVLAVTNWFGAQFVWLVIAAIPLLVSVPGDIAVALLLGLMAFRGIMAAVTNVAWNGWLRDLVPQDILGRIYSRRFSWATVAGMVFGLGSALFVDYWRAHAAPESEALGYTIVLALGATFLGMASPVFMARVPEPEMASPSGPLPSLWNMVTTPFRDANYRQLMNFLFFWSFALNLAVPFFAVYMLQRIGLSVTAVIAFSALSQATNVLFISVWGRLVDRVGSKVILSVSASLFILVILGWTFTTAPEPHGFTIPLLVILHVFAGVATAGVTLTVATIAMKLAPQGQATSYLAGASLATNVGSGLGPLAGGLLANFFATRTLALDVTWSDPSRIVQLPAFSLNGLDFLFAITFVVGLISLNTLTTIREEGEESREVVLEELLAQTRGFSRTVSSVPGLRFLAQFPYSYLRHVPGMDVAIGVTAYEVASVTKAALTGALAGAHAAGDVAGRLNRSLAGVVRQTEELGSHSIEVARQATRGVVHAADELAEDVGRLTRESVTGVARALATPASDPWDTFWGVGYGAVEASVETGMEIDQAAIQAIDGAREAAREMGLSEADATVHAALGTLEAAQQLGQEAVERLQGAVSDQLNTFLEGSEDHEEEAGR